MSNVVAAFRMCVWIYKMIPKKKKKRIIIDDGLDIRKKLLRLIL